MTKSAEPRYTLAEARKLLLHGRCVEQGHSYRVVIEGVDQANKPDYPTMVVCDHCGKEWPIAVATRARKKK